MKPSELKNYIASLIGNDISQIIIDYRLPLKHIYKPSINLKNENIIDDIRQRSYVATIAMMHNCIPNLRSQFHLDYFKRTCFVKVIGAMRYFRHTHGYINIYRTGGFLPDYMLSFNKLENYDKKNCIYNKERYIDTDFLSKVISKFYSIKNYNN
jgi:hypothetical protein